MYPVNYQERSMQFRGLRKFLLVIPMSLCITSSNIHILAIVIIYGAVNQTPKLDQMNTCRLIGTYGIYGHKQIFD